jgi:geranylgeranyl pyrophosphate synthase
MAMHTPIFSSPLAAVLGQRLHRTADALHQLLGKQQLPPALHEQLLLVLRQPGKLLASPTATGQPLSDADSSLWSLEAVLAHAVASGTDATDAPPEAWRSVLPVAMMAELLGASGDLFDDLQDGDSTLPLSAADMLSCAIALLVAASLAIAQADVPPTVSTTLQERLATGVIQSTSGQFLDLRYEHAPDITTEMALEMTRKKSGSLIGLVYEAAAIAGAYAHRPWDEVVALGALFRQFGVQLGLRHQLENDLRDADAASPKSDRARGKRTLPLVIMHDLEQHPDTPRFHRETVTALTRMAIERANQHAAEILTQLTTQYGLSSTWITWQTVSLRSLPPDDTLEHSASCSS